MTVAVTVFVSVFLEGHVMGLMLHKQATKTATVKDDTYDHLCIFFSWKQAGIGAAWQPMKPRRSCRTRRRGRFWSEIALRGTTSSPSLPWHLQDPPTCESNTRTASSSWTPSCWSNPNSSSSTASSISWSTMCSCPGQSCKGRATPLAPSNGTVQLLLTTPVYTATPSLQHLCRIAINKTTRRVQELPLPNRLKDYLTDYTYHV